MAIKPLPAHYSMTNPASVYDEEAMTALELAGRTAAKVNENVEAFNNLENNTQSAIDRQDNFLYRMQDEVLPALVEDEVQENIHNGTFDNAIDKYIGNLGTRVDNLTASYTPGSTTADAELHDIRVGAKAGETYETAGAAVRAKARLTDINRFFDNDIFTGQAKNLYPYDDASFTFPGNPSPLPQIGVNEIEIEPGNYMLVVTDTNALRLMVTYRKASDATSVINRILDVENPETGVYYFTVPTHNEKCFIRLFFGTNENNPVAGTYYFKRGYIFPENSVKIPREFVNKGASIFDCVEVIKQKGENLYTAGTHKPVDFDGVSLNVNITLEQKLAPGDYLIKIAETLPRVIITDNNDNRLLDLSDVSEIDFYKFTVPATANGIKIIGYMSTSTAVLVPAGKYRFEGITIVNDNGKPFLPDYLTRYDDVIKCVNASSIGGKYLTTTTHQLFDYGNIIIENCPNVKKNFIISFTAKLEQNMAFMRRLEIGHGYTEHMGAYVAITDTNIETYYFANTTPHLVATIPHGLTISDFITVHINVGECEKGKITLITGGGSFTTDTITWYGTRGNVFAFIKEQTYEDALFDCVLNVTYTDLDKKVWIFGDSYIGQNDTRLLGQLYKMGFKNFLASGFPGGGSGNEVKSLTTLLTLGKPDVIIWMMGMNNGDNTAVNPAWLNAVNTVKEMCKNNNITLILTTIPNCATVNNTHKNIVVRTSDYRYIDLARAVGAVDYPPTWHDGYLSSDGVHPTELGALVLANRMLIDAPEIMR